MKKIEVKANEVLLAWNCAAFCIDNGKVSEEESEDMLTLLVDLANQHRKTTKTYTLKLSLDQLKALWHSINICSKEGIIPPSKDKIRWGLFAKVADVIDAKTAFDSPPHVVLG